MVPARERSVTADSVRQPPVVAGATADHVADARHRASQVLGAEAHLGEVDDWRRAIVSARDALIVVWLLYLAFQGFGQPPYAAYFLVAMSIAFGVLVGTSSGRSTQSLVAYYESELERERTEIREHFEQEQEEVRVLYAAKGFTEPLLGKIVDVLSADDDRLLKVMMEEELGLSMHHMHHPLLVGLWNFGGALLGGLVPALPLLWITPEFGPWWMIIVGSVLLMIISVVSAWATGRSTIEFFVSGMVMALVAGGVVYYLSQWLSGFVSIANSVS